MCSVLGIGRIERRDGDVVLVAPAEQGYRAADPFDFFNIAASTLGIYRVDVDGEVYWPAGEE